MSVVQSLRDNVSIRTWALCVSCWYADGEIDVRSGGCPPICISHIGLYMAGIIAHGTTDQQLTVGLLSTQSFKLLRGGVARQCHCLAALMLASSCGPTGGRAWQATIVSKPYIALLPMLMSAEFHACPQPWSLPTIYGRCSASSSVCPSPWACGHTWPTERRH